MEELGHPQHRKRIGLRPVHHRRILKDHGKTVHGEFNLALHENAQRKGKKGSQADPSDQKSVETGTGQSASRKQAFPGIPGRPVHQAFPIVIVHPQRQRRQGIRNQVDP